DFHALIDGVAKHYEPVGVIEESLVQTIATCWWRKARVIRAENGEIRKGLDTLKVDRVLRDSDKVNLKLAITTMGLGLHTRGSPADEKISRFERWSDIQALQIDLRQHGFGLAYLSSILQHAKSELGGQGHISEKTLGDIIFGFCFWDCALALLCAQAGPPRTKEEAQTLASENQDQVGKTLTLLQKLIDERLEKISDL